jgi:hypothetical protein
MVAKVLPTGPGAIREARLMIIRRAVESLERVGVSSI